MYGWVAHCFKNYVVFKGRAGRPEYWWFYLFTGIGNLAIYFGVPRPSSAFAIAQAVWFVISGIPSWAATSRRLHDTGHSFWWAILTMLVIAPVPLAQLLNPGIAKQGGPRLAAAIGVLFLVFTVLALRLLVLLCRRGDSGPNRFGDPAPITPAEANETLQAGQR
jgi:uncharacterized membrane protein YhaH (DUF805 family)